VGVEEARDPALRPKTSSAACVIAADLSTKRDFTARVSCSKKRIKGKGPLLRVLRFYLPQAQVTARTRRTTKNGRRPAAIRVHEGATVDFDVIEEQTIEDVKRFKAREFAFDPWNAMRSRRRRSAKACEPSRCSQVPKVLSPPMKELDAAIADGRVHHDGNPVSTWMIGNVMAREDANENVLPRKEAGREENKIDGAVAVIMGLARISVARTIDIHRPAERGLDAA
jgi:phage terminase large subunit-like protein